MALARLLKVKFEKRSHTSPWLDLLSMAAALLAAFVLSALLIATSGANVGEALRAIFRGAFGNTKALLETLVQATPLIFTGLAVLVAFRAKVWNIGAEGQFFAGALITAWVSINFADLPRVILLPLILVAAMAAGAVWGGIPGFLKARLGTNEIIVTVMMNYIIRYFLSYLLAGIWSAPGDFFMQSVRFADSTALPTFFGSRLHLGFFLGLVLAGVVYLLIWKTPLGYEIRAVGDNLVSSRYKGIRISQIIVLVMMISGAIAGLAGASELSGLHHRLRVDISTGYGFTGILIALLGRLNPLGVVLAALFFGALVNGSTSMQILTGVPVALVYSVQGIVLFCLLAAEVLVKYRVRRLGDGD